MTLAAEPREQGAVGRAAAQEHVLAVVEAHPVALEGVGRPAEPAPDLHERHVRAGRGAVERSRDPGQAAADHHDTPPAAQAPPPSMLRIATQTFSRAGSDSARAARARDRPRCAPAACGRCRPSPARTRRCACPAAAPAGPCRGRTTPARARPRSARAPADARPPRRRCRGERRQLAAACPGLAGDHAKAPEILARQIDTPVLGVLAHVAQDVRQLHRDAEIVRERFGVGPIGAVPRGQAEDRQAHPPDRAGDVAAVEHEILEALVAHAVDVHAHALDQLPQRARAVARSARARRRAPRSPGSSEDGAAEAGRSSAASSAAA